MSISFRWGIANLERHTADDVVYTVHWTLSAEDGEVRASVYGSVGLEPPEEESLIPFEELSEDVVVGWLESVMGEERVAEMREGLSKQLAEQQTPSRASGLPWAG